MVSIPYCIFDHDTGEIRPEGRGCSFSQCVQEFYWALVDTDEDVNETEMLRLLSCYRFEALPLALAEGHIEK